MTEAGDGASTGVLESVLYVDDDPDICEVVQATLCLLAGLAVQTAASGELAIDLAYEMRPDLILMDVMMPGLDGPSTLRRMRENNLISAIPVIFMTAKILPAEVAHLLELGAIGVIGKPFDPLKLGDEVIAHWQAARATSRAAAIQGGEAGQEAQVLTQVTSLADAFVRRTDTDVVRLGVMFGAAGAGRRSDLEELERVAHSIHGASAIFGFPTLSAAAGAIERLAAELSTAAAPDEPIGEAALSTLTTCIGKLSREVKVARGPAPAASPYQDATLGR